MADTVAVPRADLEALRQKAAQAEVAAMDAARWSREIATTLDTMLQAKPSSLMFEHRDVTVPIVLGTGKLSEANGWTGVTEIPVPDGKWRELVSADATAGTFGGFCIGFLNTGQFRMWVDDGGDKVKQLIVPNLVPGTVLFFASWFTGDTLQVAGIDTKSLELPNGRLPCDGQAYVGQGTWRHKPCNPITPIKMPRLRAYRELTADQILADAAEWQDLVVTTPPGRAA
jgi:hypothetical protein